MTTLCFVISPRGTAGANKLLKSLDGIGLQRDRWSFTGTRADKSVTLQFVTEADAARAKTMGWDPPPTEVRDGN